MTEESDMTLRQRRMDLDVRLDSARFWWRSCLAFLILAVVALLVVVADTVVFFLGGTLPEENINRLFVGSLVSSAAVLVACVLFYRQHLRVKSLSRERENFTHRYPFMSE